MEFKARKIEVTKGDPYKHDALERKKEVDNLSLLLRNITSPIVLSINAPWGQGKTTFLEMLHADLLNNECKSIYFSAWETDFATDPLLAFLGEMNQSLGTYIHGDENKSVAWENTKKASKHILKRAIPVAIKLGSAGLIDADKILEAEASKLLEGLSKDAIEEYSKSKEAIATFKENIGKVLIDENGVISKLYIFVDELDRCRPTYAIELLERIKHILDIEGLVFILALDKEQLSHSVRGVYGANFEAQGYLRRFFDIEYQLPQADLKAFIDSLCNSFQFNEFYEKRKKYPAFQYDSPHLTSVFNALVKRKRLSLREVEQLLAKINLVFLSTKESTYIYPVLLTFLIVLKEYYFEIYKEYISNHSVPDSIIEVLYNFFPKDVRYKSNDCALIEGFLIAAKSEDISGEVNDKLKEKHSSVIIDKDNQNIEEKRYSSMVLEVVKKPTSDWGIDLEGLISRIEMLEQFNF